MKSEFTLRFTYNHPKNLKDDVTNDLIKTLLNLQGLQDIEDGLFVEVKSELGTVIHRDPS